jgi:CRISPR/Cas system-associated protein Csm6
MPEIKVITPVGTSLFDNYLDNKKTDISDSYKKIKNQDKKIRNKEDLSKQWEKLKKDIDNIKTKISSWAKGKKDASAEVESLLNILDKIDADFHVYLIATQTVSSRLAANILVDILDGYTNSKGKKITVCFHPKDDVIPGLQIWDKNDFEDNGLKNLFERLDSISMKSRKEDVILNITGGYKGVIPYLTIFAQLKEFQTFYIFEDSESLIQIPRLPVQFDWGIAEQYYPYLSWDLNLNEVGEKVKEGLKHEIEGLKQLHLMYSDQNGQWNVTAIGKMFKEFIDKELPIAKNVLGYFVEYKLLEHYLKNPYKDMYNIVERKGGKGEPDLILTNDKSNDFVVVESKSFLQFGTRQIKRKKRQIKKQIEKFPKDKIPKEYHLCIYIYQEYQKDLVASNLSEVKKLFDNFCIFKLFYLHIDLTRDDLSEGEIYYKNPYQKFVDSSIELKPFKL